MCSLTQPSSYRVMSTKSVPEVIIDGSAKQYLRLEENRANAQRERGQVIYMGAAVPIVHG